MLDPNNIPDIEQDETLARFVFFSGHFRSSDNSVKPNAFMPPSSGDLSVTRHREATEAELWNEARRVAALRGVTPYGRADTAAGAFTTEKLRLVEDPELPWNPNHAVAIQWPTEKDAQKMIAVELARKSAYLPAP